MLHIEKTLFAGWMGLVSLLLVVLLPLPMAAGAEPGNLETIHRKAKPCVDAGDYAGALAVLKNVSINAGPRRLIFCPTNEMIRVVADPSRTGAFICVGDDWLAGYDMPSNTFTRRAVFPDDLTRLLNDLQLIVWPRAATVVGSRLVVDFARYSRQGGGTYGLFVCFDARTLAVEWVYDHDNDYVAWTADEHSLAIGDETSGAVLGITMPDGVATWENTEVRCGWKAMASGEGVHLAGGRDALAAFDSATGRLLWRQTTAVESMVLAGPVVICASREGLAAWRIRTGDRLWEKAFPLAGNARVTGSYGGQVAVVAGDRLLLVDGATGTVMLDHVLDGRVEPEAVALDETCVHLRTDCAYLCLDKKGQLLHQMVITPRNVGRHRPEGRAALLPAPGGYVIDQQTSGILNAGDRVTVDDLLEMRVACRVLAKGASASASAFNELAPLNRGIGSLLPAVLKAMAKGDPTHENALLLANLDRSSPDARLQMLATLRQQAGLLWYRRLDGYPLPSSPPGVLLVTTARGGLTAIESRTGRTLYQLEEPSGLASWPTITAAGHSFAQFVEDPPQLVCRDIQSGRIEWKRELEPTNAVPFTGDPATNGTDTATNSLEAIVLIGGWAGQVTAYSPADGSVRWRVPMLSGRNPGQGWDLTSALEACVEHVRPRPEQEGTPVLRGLDLRDGHELWRHELESGDWLTGRRDGRVGRYLSWITHPQQSRRRHGRGQERTATALDVRTGTITWTEDIPGLWMVSSCADLILLLSGSQTNAGFQVIDPAMGKVVSERNYPGGWKSLGGVEFINGKVFLPLQQEKAISAPFIRNHGGSLMIDVSRDRDVGCVAVPDDIINQDADVLLGVSSDRRHALALDWSRVVRTALQTPADGLVPRRSPSPRKEAR